MDESIKNLYPLAYHIASYYSDSEWSGDGVQVHCVINEKKFSGTGLYLDEAVEALTQKLGEWDRKLND